MKLPDDSNGLSVTPDMDGRWPFAKPRVFNLLAYALNDHILLVGAAAQQGHGVSEECKRGHKAGDQKPEASPIGKAKQHHHDPQHGAGHADQDLLLQNVRYIP